jgi:hypothetical protein
MDVPKQQVVTIVKRQGFDANYANFRELRRRVDGVETEDGGWRMAAEAPERQALPLADNLGILR